MKKYLINFISAVVFAVMLSALTSCSNTANSQMGPTDDLPDGPVRTAANSKDSEYPPMVTAVTTAEIKSFDGSTFKIEDKKGKILLLNLWATWCGPCRAEIPALVKMQEEHGSKGFEVIGLNTDDELPELIDPFAKELKINYQIAYADRPLQSSLLKVSKFAGIPQSFLIDRDGRLRGVFRGASPVDIAKMEQVVADVVEKDPE